MDPKRTFAFIWLDLSYNRRFCTANSPINRLDILLCFLKTFKKKSWSNEGTAICKFNSCCEIDVNRVNLVLLAQIYLSPIFRVCHIFTQLLTFILSVRRILSFSMEKGVRKQCHIKTHLFLGRVHEKCQMRHTKCNIHTKALE